MEIAARFEHKILIDDARLAVIGLDEVYGLAGARRDDRTLAAKLVITGRVFRPKQINPALLRDVEPNEAPGHRDVRRGSGDLQRGGA
jgi:hypothetical protein